MEPQSGVEYLYTVLDSHETDHWGWRSSPALELAIPDGVATEERIMRSKNRNQGYTFSSRSPHHSISYTSFLSRTDTVRSSRPWRRCAGVRI
jgi:hypothetical protein